MATEFSVRLEAAALQSSAAAASSSRHLSTSSISLSSIPGGKKPSNVIKAMAPSHVAAIAVDDSATTAAKYLYMWNGASNSLVKVGTGRHGTSAGVIYGTCTHVSAYCDGDGPLPEVRHRQWLDYF